MALWHSRVKVIGRSQKAFGKNGRGRSRSVVAAAAYRSGNRLKDERYDVTHDYRRRVPGVVFSDIYAPADAPEWMRDREKLWNGVEAREKRKDAQLCRDIELALPVELTAEQNQKLVHDFVERELVSRGMVVDVNIHEPIPKDGQRNPHVHLLLTMRDIDKEKFGNKNRTWNDDALYNGLLDTWEKDTNAVLERIGAEARVDRRSFEERGIDQLPGVHRGVAVEQMQQQGMETRVGELEAERKFDQAIYPYVKEITEKGELQHNVPGMEPLTWRERLSDVAIRAREAAARVYEQVSDRVRGWFQQREEERREEERRRDRTMEPQR